MQRLIRERVPFLNLRAAQQELATRITDALEEALFAGQYVLGPQVRRFEASWAEYCGTQYCVGTGNGLDALRIALLSGGVGRGDEVLVPASTFIATWLAVSAVGALPVGIDADITTYGISAGAIADKVTSRTRAVIPVHLYGLPCDMDPIVAVTRRHDLLLIEDAAQAHGATYRGRPVGSIGDMACWSFYPAKNLGGVGDGGAITTSNRALADTSRAIANYGSAAKYVHRIQGLNSRLDELQAAILSVKLELLDEWNRRRQRIAHLYMDGLRSSSVELPPDPSWAQSSWHLFVVRSNRRDALRAYLDRAGVHTLVHYPTPPHLQEAYASLGLGLGRFPVCELLAGQVLSLPIGPHLSDNEVDRVITAILAFDRQG